MMWSLVTLLREGFAGRGGSSAILKDAFEPTEKPVGPEVGRSFGWSSGVSSAAFMGPSTEPFDLGNFSISGIASSTSAVLQEVTLVSVESELNEFARSSFSVLFGIAVQSAHVP